MFGIRKFFRRDAAHKPVVQPASKKRSVRQHEVELLERRQLLAGDVQIGAVYYEEDSGQDSAHDWFHVSFNGGPDEVQLAQLVVDTDKAGDGLSVADAFFDTEAGGLGAFDSHGLSIIEQTGIDTVSASVVDGGTQIIFTFAGFDPGDKLVFGIDVDEQGFLPTSASAVTEGAEFEGSKLIGTFVAPHYEELTGSAVFLDSFSLAGTGLDLPPDSYLPLSETPQEFRTAGAEFSEPMVPLPITISGTVYEDFNLNNSQDVGDLGIAGVTLSLEEFNGSSYVSTGKTAVTDGDGNYEFDDILPGQYRVVETQPVPYFSVGATAGTVNGGTVGIVVSPDIIADISLLGGQDSIDNDFAEAKPASLAGNVYHDADDDGVFDPTETGIGGVTIQVQYLPLAGPPEAPIEVQTLADGSWSVGGLRPGNYLVREIHPSGYIDGKDAPGTAGGAAQAQPGDLIQGVFLASGQAGTEYNFGEILPSSISGFVHADRDGNCEIDPGDVRLEGVTVHLLDSAGTRIATTTTDSQGRYEFTGLAPGLYGIEEEQPTGYFDSGDHIGTAGGVLVAPDTISSILLVSGTNAENYNFCEHEPASISGHVYADDNNNGVFDAAEQPIAGVTLQLLDAAGNPTGATTTTDAAGFYRFGDLPQGIYGVAEVQPAGFYDGIDAAGSAGGSALNPGDRITGATLTPNLDAVNYDFGELRPGSISGHVYVDDNNNAVFDAGEQPLAGVMLELLDATGTGTGITTVTDATGFYQFANLAPGVYGVAEAQPIGYFDGLDAAGNAGGTADNPGDRITGAVISAGMNAINYDFGELLPGSISGRVHADRDGDCVFTEGDVPLGGVTVHLLNADGVRIASTQTDADGRYQFDNLAPGVYGIEEEQPIGYFDGEEHIGTAGGTVVQPDTVSGIVVGSGVTAANYDFCEQEPASIAGRVYTDDNNNGVFDAGEQPLAGVTLQLLDAAGNPTGITTLTDASGNYQFNNLQQGKYGIAEVQPIGYYDGTDTPGTAGGTAENPGDRILNAMLMPGVNAVNYDFGELRPASISGTVHVDTDGDCLIDADEQRLAGVTIYLLDGNGNRIGETQSSEDGTYFFTNLAPGEYGIEQVQPVEYSTAGEHVGSAGGAVTADNFIRQIVLTPGTAAFDYNFCEQHNGSISGYVFQDGDTIQLASGEELNASNLSQYRTGERTPDDTPLEGITIRLLDLSGAEVVDPATGQSMTAVTDENGYYEFTGLAPGVYTLVQSHPESYLDGIDTAGTTGGLAINAGVDADLLPQSVVSTMDAIYGVVLPTGGASVENNFSEVVVEQAVEPTGTVPFFPTNPPTTPPLIIRPPAGGGLQPQIGAPSPNPGIERETTFFGGSGSVEAGYTWHLSIIDGGQPRGDKTNSAQVVQVSTRHINAMRWSPEELQASEWVIPDEATGTDRIVYFGMEDGTPVTGDWNGDGVTEIGVFRDGEWFLDLNGNGQWDEGDLWAKLGSENDRPVTGDWDGDGKTDIGIFGPEWFGDTRALVNEPGLPDAENEPTGERKNTPPRRDEAASENRILQRHRDGRKREDVIDHVFRFGDPDDIPVTGDWNGDGIDTVGVFAAGQWFLDTNGDGTWQPDDEIFSYGQLGDLPVVGDFDGDGIDELGIYRDGHWYIDLNHNGIIDSDDIEFIKGKPGDVPVVGDWNGDGIDEPGLYRDGKMPRVDRSQ